ncbi:MAG: leucyl aminopeptidase [Chloroflexota bacterium]|nr:leucyl aminopeptidase [Chloroflexota bacterium]
MDAAHQTTYQTTDPLALDVDALVVPVGRRDDQPGLDGVAAVAAAAFDGAVETMVADARFGAKAGDVLRLPTLGRLPARYLILTGVGDPATLTADVLRRAMAAASRSAREVGAVSLGIALPDAGDRLDSSATLAAVAEGLHLAAYRFTTYRGTARSTPLPPLAERVTVAGPEGSLDPAMASAILARVAATGRAVASARDLVNEPASVITPVTMAERARQVAAEAGLDIQVLGPDALAGIGAGAMLAVGQGSATPPQLIHLTYRPAGEPSGREIGLVGKCITFDTGGYSIKTHDGMLTMKGDMAGGAAVLATMSALAATGCPHVVHGVICAAENMISGTAFRPSDILTASNGVTIEVLSTDAEGRLVLADALVYTARAGATELIDLATLTGGAVVALGNDTAALFASDDRLAGELAGAATEAGEATWRMPLLASLEEQIRGDVGDLKNSGGRAGSAITAALFLQHFREGLPWAHLDIAGPAFAAKAHGYVPKGGTGFGVRTLLTYLSATTRA